MLADANGAGDRVGDETAHACQPSPSLVTTAGLHAFLRPLFGPRTPTPTLLRRELETRPVWCEWPKDGLGIQVGPESGSARLVSPRRWSVGARGDGSRDAVLWDRCGAAMDVGTRRGGAGTRLLLRSAQSLIGWTVPTLVMIADVVAEEADEYIASSAALGAIAGACLHFPASGEEIVAWASKWGRHVRARSLMAAVAPRPAHGGRSDATAGASWLAGWIAATCGAVAGATDEPPPAGASSTEASAGSFWWLR